VLQWQDVDLDRGIITVREAKNQKQRVTPMDASLIKTLEYYRRMTVCEKICVNYLFESDHNYGKPFQRNAFYTWFMRVVEKAGIIYSKNSICDRGGPHPHSLRHTFTFKSFLKSESDGKRFEDYAPFLAAYLGHDSPVETEEYLRSNHTVYRQSHQRVNAAIGSLFPEVDFNEE